MAACDSNAMSNFRYRLLGREQVLPLIGAERTTNSLVVIIFYYDFSKFLFSLKNSTTAQMMQEITTHMVQVISKDDDAAKAFEADGLNTVSVIGKK